jgi:hypothetical protein
MLEGWQKFLDSLATKGGNLFVLSLFVASLLLLVLHVLHRGGGSDPVTTVLLSTFSGFSGALLAALTGQVGGQRKTDSNGAPTPIPNGGATK